MNKIKVLVTGANGQVGQALQKLSAVNNDLEFHFYGSAEADVTNPDSLNDVFNTVRPQYCINCAAYTAVDKAETEFEKAHLINADGAANLAQACKEHGTVLLHISTDFVFDGTKNEPYNELDTPNPTSVYGKTKLEGEKRIAAILHEHYIIRTAWVYSEFGNNFMKTMLRLAAERDALNIVNDQHGTPTNANDLAEALIYIIKHNKGHYGLYHYSNEGEATWYSFAKAIFAANAITINAQPILTEAFPTPAKRPVYSVLSKQKIKEVFGLQIPQWEERLKKQNQVA